MSMATVARLSAQTIINSCRKLAQQKSPYIKHIPRINQVVASKVSRNQAFFCQPIVQFSSTVQVEETNEPDVLYKKIILTLKSHDDAVIESYQQYVTMTANELGLKEPKTQCLRKHINRITHLKSRHIYKKHRVQYEIRTYKRQIEFQHLTGSTADTLLEYIERNIPEGVAMRVQKVEVVPLPSHIKPPLPKEDA
ncbi:small ribosomal subunit protein uS10m-like [Saccoglossus kowalevskii]|uniref:Small ribosomal subunit protein uS10m n=1 Tax=Saccoglossus kowalevskii TaxID=10224 RepID=A0ABM0GIT8_SACKO|nr:PREDICTED: 28S ribosomal protein S10, mitochondrial-like [Saccoglossus kowalevskii]